MLNEVNHRPSLRWDPPSSVFLEEITSRDRLSLQDGSGMQRYDNLAHSSYTGLIKLLFFFKVGPLLNRPGIYLVSSQS